MLSPLPHSRIPFIEPDFRASSVFYNFLRDLVATQIPIGGILISLSQTAPKGYLPLGSTFSKDKYPDLYAILGTETIPSGSDSGLYLADVPDASVGSIFGDNVMGLQHLHTAVTVASGTGASVSGANSGNMVQGDNRPRTLGVKFYVRAE